MTLPEWTAALIAECAAQGWTAEEHCGFPLVKRPTDFEDGVRFLKHQFSVPVEYSIYAEGCLLLPPGSHAMRRR